MSRDYVLEYAQAVTSGSIVAGKKIKQACQRELNDRKRQNTKDFPYHFDTAKAAKVIKFIEVFNTPEGEPVVLQPFQKWLLSELFGWVDDKGTRRFRECFISMSRKQGKSFLISMIGLVYLFIEPYPKLNKQVIFSANTYKQAKLTFDQCRSELIQAMRTSPALRQRLTVHKEQITDLVTNSTVRPVATGNGTQENLSGVRGDLICVDEYEAAKTRDSLNILKSGMTSKNALLAIISTSGFNISGPMFEDYQINSKVLNGQLSNDRNFIAIFEQDSEDEVNKPELWEKSNPLLCLPSVSEILRPKLENDLLSARQSKDENSVLVKNFNLWRKAAESSFVDMNKWQDAQIAKPNIDGKHIIFGVDLSKSNDLTSISWLVDLENGKYFADSHSFVANKNDDIVAKGRRERVNYIDLARKNECDISQTDSGVIDYDVIYQWLLEFIRLHNLTVDAIAYDPYQMSYLIPRLEQDYQMVTVRQNNKTLSAPTKDFQDKILTKTIVHADNTLLQRAVENGVLVYDSTNSVRLDKKRNSEKIDPLAALLDAYTYLFNNQLEDIKNNADNHYYENYKF